MHSNRGTTQCAERCHDLAFYYYDVYHNDDAIYTMVDKKVVENLTNLMTVQHTAEDAFSIISKILFPTSRLSVHPSVS